MLERILGPVGTWELTRASRRESFLGMRLAVVIAVLVPLGLATQSIFPYGRAPAAEMVDRWSRFTPAFTVPVLHLLFAAAILTVPVIFAPLLAAERERRTLDVLLMTGQRAEDVVFGRWLAGLAQTLVIVAAPTPVLFLGTIYGGMDNARILNVLGVLGLTVMSLSALTLLVSSFTRNLRETWAGLLSIVVLTQIGPEAIAGIGQFLIRFELLSAASFGWFLAAIDDLQQRFHPWPLLRDQLSTGPLPKPVEVGRLGWFAIGHLAATWLLLKLTVRFITRGHEVGTAPRRFSFRLPGHALDFRDRPVFVREWRIGSGSAQERWLDRLLTAGTLISFWLPIYGELLHPWPRLYRFFGNFTNDDLMLFLPRVGGVLAALALVRVMLQAAGALSNERERDTLASLLATPIDAEDLIEQKMLGACRPMARFLLGALPPLVILFLSGRIGLVGVLGPLTLLPLLTLVTAVIGVSADAFTGRRAVASILTIVAVLGLIWLTSLFSTEQPSFRLSAEERRTEALEGSAPPGRPWEDLRANLHPVVAADAESAWLPALAFRTRTAPFVVFDVRFPISLALVALAGLLWLTRHLGTRAFLIRSERIDEAHEAPGWHRRAPRADDETVPWSVRERERRELRPPPRPMSDVPSPGRGSR